MPLIAERVPEVKLIIAGRGESLKNYFPNDIDERRYEICNGFISNEEVAGLFQRSTVTVLPYTEASQSGVAAISYGLGTPVVASRVGGLPEIIRDGEDGLLVPPGNAQALANAVIRLLLDPELQQRMRTAMAQRCQDDLNWSRIAATTMDVYRKTLESR
jgi:glycosyltransferase involved in cell wall biosynthesis